MINQNIQCCWFVTKSLVHSEHPINHDGNLKRDKKLSFLFSGIRSTLEEMPDNGVVLVVTDSGTQRGRLANQLQRTSERKNIKIIFVFAPSCRNRCRNSLPVYRRLSDGRMFNRTDFDQEIFFKSVVHMVCIHCWSHPPTPHQGIARCLFQL